MNRKKFTILTAAADTRLVWRESTAAFSRMGHTVVVREEITAPGLARIFSLPAARSGLAERPSLLFSINGNGLDKYGEVYRECERNSLPVAVWLVDNPWNVLSGLRDDFWKRVFLFVTDPSFIPDLEKHGAKHVRFLPLATDPGLFAQKTVAGETGARVVFVGRSEFPDKKRFFVGQSVPEELRHAALSLLKEGGRPDFSWWREKLFPEKTVLWPGSAARQASLGAEESSLAWRTVCLEAAAETGLAVYGDLGWKGMLPEGVTLLPPVDYYTALPGIYANAPFSLVTMSFLLPHACNQRHFDIWAAGGFALLDDAPGLDIFPGELTEPVTYKKPEDIPHLVARFADSAGEKAALREKWRKIVFAEHTYDHRTATLLRTIFT